VANKKVAAPEERTPFYKWKIYFGKSNGKYQHIKKDILVNSPFKN